MLGAGHNRGSLPFPCGRSYKIWCWNPTLLSRCIARFWAIHTVQTRCMRFRSCCTAVNTIFTPWKHNQPVKPRSANCVLLGCVRAHTRMKDRGLFGQPRPAGKNWWVCSNCGIKSNPFAVLRNYKIFGIQLFTSIVHQFCLHLWQIVFPVRHLLPGC